MTRPLCYDDTFINVVDEKLYAKFLNLFTLKVKKNAFFKKLSLLQSLVISALFDIILGIIFSLIFFKIEFSDINTSIKFQLFIVMIGFIFGFIGINVVISMTRYISLVYKNWRLFITFSYPILEINNGFYICCLLLRVCNYFLAFLLLIIFFSMNIYLTLVSWSFFIRLDQAHELLIIHGSKKLKLLMENDFFIGKSYYDDFNYTPPDLMHETIKNKDTSNKTESQKKMLHISSYKFL